MLAERYGRFVPRFLLRRLMSVETRIETAVDELAARTPAGALVLDAGSGEGRYAGRFSHARYVGVDLGVGDADWDYSVIDVGADLSDLPFPDDTFDAALNIVVLEHTPRPGQVLQELHRVLKPGGELLLVAPQQWEVHQQPHDYFRFTRYGLTMLLGEAGFQDGSIEPIGGYFTLLARRLIGALNYFQGGARWLLFPFVVAVVGPAALIIPSLDFLDKDKDFTLAYVCVARKH